MIRTLNENTKKIGRQAFRVVPRGRRDDASTGTAGAVSQLDPRSRIRENAKLKDNVKCLYVMWDEYIRGIGLNIAAKDFTKHESGNIELKSTYSNRKVIWDFVKTMIGRGYDAKTAIALIYKAYAPLKTPTPIIIKLRKDVKN